MYKVFCCRFIALIFCGLFMVALVNYLIDPYAVWGSKKVAGINMGYLKIMDIERWAMPMHFTILPEQPEVVFLGDSQVRWGMDLKTYEDETGKSVYNFGIPSMTGYEQIEYVKHILSVDKNLKELVLCLDYSMYVNRDKGEKYLEGFDEKQIGLVWPTGENVARALFSWDAVKDSINTIKLNYRNKWQVPFTSPTGGLSDDVILLNYHRDLRTFDNTVNRLQREEKNVGDSLNEESFKRLKDIVKMCDERDVKLTLLIMPLHARQIEMYAGHWPLYEEWMRRLVLIAPVWTFIDYNAITMSDSDVGPITLKTNEFFWDAVHPKHKLGDIIQRVLLRKETEWQDIGLLVNKSNVEDYIKQLCLDRYVWENEHPNEVEYAHYSSGFFKDIPRRLAFSKEMPYSEDVILDLKSRSGNINIKRSQNLELWGNLTLNYKDVSCIYAVLEDASGKKYYSVVEYPVMKTGDYNATYADSELPQSFHLQMPVSNVQENPYMLKFIILTTDNTAYVTDCKVNVFVE